MVWYMTLENILWWKHHDNLHYLCRFNIIGNDNNVIKYRIESTCVLCSPSPMFWKSLRSQGQSLYLFQVQRGRFLINFLVSKAESLKIGQFLPLFWLFDSFFCKNTQRFRGRISKFKIFPWGQPWYALKKSGLLPQFSVRLLLFIFCYFDRVWSSPD